jgi:hypothetical protein
MKRVLIHLVGIVGLFFMSVPAQAIVLLDEDFSTATINNSVEGNNLISLSTADDNLETWIDSNDQKWRITDSTGAGFGTAAQGNFAQHQELASHEGNLLWYSFINPGTTNTLSLDFDYILSFDDGEVIIGGLNYGENNLDKFAPWFSGVLGGGTDTNDGDLLFQSSLANTNGTTFQSVHFDIFDPDLATYDVLAIGFAFNGTSGYRGVDNILLQTAPVPEPSTLLLLGGGLAGLGMVSWRRRRGK